MLRKCDVRQDAEAVARAKAWGRKAALVSVGLVAIHFTFLVAQFAMGPSAEGAIADAESGDGYDYVFALEREYVDGEGRTVYRLVSDSDPVVVKEMRYGFRWLPELSISPAVVPSLRVSHPGPYYDIANEDEWRRSWLKWDRDGHRKFSGW